MTRDLTIIGAKANNLKNLSLELPLNQFIAITGVSGSGKSSLAMDTIYAEGARRYLSALSTYTRRRIDQMSRPNVGEISNLPSTIALKQRPQTPSSRSTVGTMTEELNILRLMFSRLGSHVCPNGHRIEPTLDIAKKANQGSGEVGQIHCPVCQVLFTVPSAEDFAFNAAGACPTCDGLGQLQVIEIAKIIPDTSLTIRQGAVKSWRLPGRSQMIYVVEQLGVPIDVPYESLTPQQKEIVENGPMTKRDIVIPTTTGKSFAMSGTYENAVETVRASLKNAKNEKSVQRLARFYSTETCPTCHGTRFNPKLLSSQLVGQNIAEVSALTLDELKTFIQTIDQWLPKVMREMASVLTSEALDLLAPLESLGLDYLAIARGGNTLSTGELQRIQLARTIRSQMTGILYVLDEPSIGLHPANVEGVVVIIKELVAQGNSVLVVEHDLTIIAAAEMILEIGKGAGRAGGKIVAQGELATIESNHQSLIGPYLTGEASVIFREPAKEVFDKGNIELYIDDSYNIHQLTARFAVEKLNVITGVSGSGKTTLALDNLVPALKGEAPTGSKLLADGGIRRVIEIDAAPVGKNNRSTVATYSKIMDKLRRLYGQLPESQAKGYSDSYFSYNNSEGACPVCQGTGSVTLDIQYLPDMVSPCPKCHGKRYNDEILAIKWRDQSIADLLAMTVSDASDFFRDYPDIAANIGKLKAIGLGYLKLGETTPHLSGGEAQRLKLSTYLTKNQHATLFVFDEPSIGLHPQDIALLITIFDQMVQQGATIIVIEHEMEIIANADYIVDMGPKGGEHGGQVVAQGTVAEVRHQSLTGRYLDHYLTHFHH